MQPYILTTYKKNPLFEVYREQCPSGHRTAALSRQTQVSLFYSAFIFQIVQKVQTAIAIPLHSVFLSEERGHFTRSYLSHKNSSYHIAMPWSKRQFHIFTYSYSDIRARVCVYMHIFKFSFAIDAYKHIHISFPFLSEKFEFRYTCQESTFIFNFVSRPKQELLDI